MNSTNMQPGIDYNAQTVPTATSQMANMSLSAGVPNRIPPVDLQPQLTTNQIAGGGSTATIAAPGLLPLPVQGQFTGAAATAATGHNPSGTFQAVPPAIPASLNVMSAHLQQHTPHQAFIGAGQPNNNLNSPIIQSPQSPLTNNAALFGQTPPVNQHTGSQGVVPLPQQTSSPILSPSTPPIIPHPSMPYGHHQDTINSYPDIMHTQHHNNNINNNSFSHDEIQLSQLSQLSQLQQEQIQLLKQKQLIQQQIYQQTNQQHIQQQQQQQQQQQLANQTINNTSFQFLPQGHNAPIPSNSPQLPNNLAQVAMTTTHNMVSSEHNPNVNTLPHTLPTTLNPSLKKKPMRNVLNSSGSMSPMSPRNGLFQDSWDIYDESNNTSGVGSSISSPMSPGPSWSEYMTPRYDPPTDRDHCLKCNQRVYAMEKVGPVRDVLYHKNCFTCAACGTKLTLKSFHHNPNDSDDNNVFCASHKPRVVNIASDGNAFYVPRTSPRTQQTDPRHDSSVQYEAYPRPIPQSVIAEEDEYGSEVETSTETTTTTTTTTTTMTDQPDGKPDTDSSVTNNEGDITKVNVDQVAQSDTPPGSKKSLRSNNNSESSPFSSVSSSSSYATSLKAESNDDPEFRSKDNENEFPNYARSDRPSSISSVSTTSSTENLKMKAGYRDRKSSAEQQETSSIASNSSLERPDRPSCVQRSVSTTDQPCNKALSELKKSGKMLVKSHSSQDFTHNNLKAVVEPRRLLPRNESMRMDRPSQYH